jgi:small basic protein (TIGR04137 family)
MDYRLKPCVGNFAREKPEVPATNDGLHGATHPALSLVKGGLVDSLPSLARPHHPAPPRRSSTGKSSMSIHSSFASKGGFSKHRNVLSRAERIERLKGEDRWTLGKNKVTGLPKVRNIKSA